ncbi:type 1 periplasmic-binding domain-containing protein [Pedobacter metabolipauper]|uniref:Regulatory GntR family protein n=1 Tax=Pedobacter metabolipauper TaxID=425513 RepID=A0A4R6SUK5_9SPHI|nr:winged helix-turn-helix domain-containing protein [Pedobacter metabolipauper]TDQ08091.1 regulatory GntR family protein [Pedobacter metabolipauper]
MPYEIFIDKHSKVAKHQQMARSIMIDIEAGILPVNSCLPSIREFSKNHKIAKETVENGYNLLRSQGYIVSVAGKGFYVVRGALKEIRVLMILNELNDYKKEVYESFVHGLGQNSKVDIQIFHNSIEIFKDIIEANRDLYHYFVVMPQGLKGNQSSAYVHLLNTVTASKLVVLDEQVQLEREVINVYQDFEHDIFDALMNGKDAFDKYDAVNLILAEQSNQSIEIVSGIRAFCHSQNKEFILTEDISDVVMKEGTAYIVLTDDELGIAVKKIKTSKLIMGHDIGLLSFNETAWKELLGITVVSTDFAAMGRTAAELLLKKDRSTVKNKFIFYSRQSL